ncbi:MAG: hypothetical protein R3D33_07870 [Hyphomicrobiaceae bacterium]
MRARIAAIVERPAGLSPIPHPASDAGEVSSACCLFPSSCAESPASAGRAISPASAEPADWEAQDLPGREPWTFGIPALDGLLPWRGLHPAGLHELKPASAGDAPAAVTLALALAARRLARHPQATVLWAVARPLEREIGRLHAPGLAALGIPWRRIVLVEDANAAATLAAMEEGLRSGALGAVVGLFEQVAMLPARRLALAARTGRTPCLVLTGSRRAALPVCHTGWQIAPAPGAPHPFDRASPGARRWQLTLARCRGRAGGDAFLLEWSDETVSFALVPALADRAPAQGEPRRHTP